MKKVFEKNNKGFSLVELIIVIAIMAILVGVMAPQLIKYIEKANVAADTQMADNVRKAIYYAMMDPAVLSANDKSKDMIEDLTQPDAGVYYHNLACYTGSAWLDCAFAKAVTESLGGWNPFDMYFTTEDEKDYLKSTPKAGAYLGFTAACDDDGNFAIFVQNSDRYGEKNGETFTGGYEDLEDSRVIYVK